MENKTGKNHWTQGKRSIKYRIEKPQVNRI